MLQCSVGARCPASTQRTQQARTVNRRLVFNVQLLAYCPVPSLNWACVFKPRNDWLISEKDDAMQSTASECIWYLSLGDKEERVFQNKTWHDADWNEMRCETMFMLMPFMCCDRGRASTVKWVGWGARCCARTTMRRALRPRQAVQSLSEDARASNHPPHAGGAKRPEPTHRGLL